MSKKVYDFAAASAHILSLCMTLLFCITGFFFTSYALDMETQKVLYAADNVLVNLLALAVVGGIFSLVAWRVRRGDKYIEKILLCLSVAVLLILGGVLIVFGKTVPAADAYSVYDAAARLAVGDTSVIHPTDSYLSYYPQQVGLMAFLEVLHRIWNLLGIDQHAYHFIKGIYVVLTIGTVIAQYKTIKLWTKEKLAACFYLVIAMLNLPMIMYSSFVYSEVPSFCAFSFGLYFLVRFLRGRASERNSEEGSEQDSEAKKVVLEAQEAERSQQEKTCGGWLWLPAVVCFTLSVMLRKNALILMIAVVLVLCLEALRKKSIKILGVAVLCLALSLSILPMVQKGYELRAGNTLKSGVTPLSYIAMGMQESSRADGWYNGFNFYTYEENGMDAEAANEISRAAIRERWNYFTERPSEMASFYWEKYLSQWGDGTYASRQATLATFGGRNAFFKSLYEGSGSRAFIAYGNGYQTCLYLGALLFVLLPMKTWKDALKKKADLLTYLGFIAVFGGLLFHMMWEANSRYIFTYSLLLMPYGAAGFGKLPWSRNRQVAVEEDQIV